MKSNDIEDKKKFDSYRKQKKIEYNKKSGEGLADSENKSYHG